MLEGDRKGSSREETEKKKKDVEAEKRICTRMCVHDVGSGGELPRSK